MPVIKLRALLQSTEGPIIIIPSNRGIPRSRPVPAALLIIPDVVVYTLWAKARFYEFLAGKTVCLSRGGNDVSTVRSMQLTSVASRRVTCLRRRKISISRGNYRRDRARRRDRPTDRLSRSLFEIRCYLRYRAVPRLVRLFFARNARYHVPREPNQNDLKSGLKRSTLPGRSRGTRDTLGGRCLIRAG